MCVGGEDVAYTRTTDLFMTERKEIRGRIVCVCVGGVEDVAYTRTTDLFMTERKEIRGRIVCVWGGGKMWLTQGRPIYS